MSIEKAFNIVGAKVVWADYDKLGSFLKAENKQQKYRFRRNIDSWLLDTFSYISEPHTRDNEVHERPLISGRSIDADRPDFFGRTLVVEACGIRFDIKGAGLKSNCIPVNKSHKTGLLQLSRAMNELFITNLLSNILTDENIVEVVPVLSLIHI